MLLRKHTAGLILLDNTRAQASRGGLPGTSPGAQHRVRRTGNHHVPDHLGSFWTLGITGPDFWLQFQGFACAQCLRIECWVVQVEQQNLT